MPLAKQHSAPEGCNRGKTSAFNMPLTLAPLASLKDASFTNPSFPPIYLASLSVLPQPC